MNRLTILFLALLSTMMLAGLAVADVNGASSVTEISTSRGNTTSPQSDGAMAGNITEVTLVGSSTTQSWQGYVGNVSGAISLEDASGNALYNWSLASPQGEVYASTNNSVTWSGVDCFNLTGATVNATSLESDFGISSTAADGVDETFSVGNNHDAFSSGSTSFTLGQCPSTQIYDSSGTGVDNNFEEVLLTDTFNNVIFTALLEEDLAGYNGNAYDFEMIVLEDGHSGDVATTPYYFYVELE